MKEPKLYKLYFEYRHEVQPKDDVFVCICRAEQVEKITKHYYELWDEIVERQICRTLNEYSIEELTNDPVLQGWESFAGTILEDLEPEPGKRFYYWEDGVDGYTLEPILSVVGGS